MADKNKYFYSIDNAADCYEIESIWDIEEDGEYLAEDAAENYHSEHDGWEDTWPIKINLHKEDEGDVVATYGVDLEHTPTFSATKADA